MDKIKLDVQEKGDLGIVAEASRSTQRTMFQPAHLTIQGVFAKLKEIANLTGNSVSYPLPGCSIRVETLGSFEGKTKLPRQKWIY